MRPQSYARWVDPAPLEVQRPRLPWWTMLPRKVLLTLSPIIALAIAVTVAVFVARRVWRYPLFLFGAAVLAGVGLAWSWWASARLLAVLGLVGGLWAWRHGDSFARVVLRQARSEWRRAVVYAFRWRRVMLFSGLTKRTGHGLHRVHYPRIRRVRSDGWRDRVSVRLLHGQCAEHYATQADALAHSFGARPCRVRAYRPRRLWLDLIHSDPLAALLRVPALTDPDAGVDLARIPVGRTETGRAWVLRLLDRHVLVGRAERPGPVDPDDRVQVFGIDPKGGMFQGWGGWWVCRVVCTRWVSGVSRRW